MKRKLPATELIKSEKPVTSQTNTLKVKIPLFESEKEPKTNYIKS